MRVGLFLWVALGMAFQAGGPLPPAPPEKETLAKRLASLTGQLGHPEFTKREAASQELEAMGVPALDALRKATTSEDIEIRRRAERILQAITRRTRAAAAKKELARWQGKWAGAEGQKLVIQGDQWLSSTPTFGPVSGTLQNIEVREKMTLVDLVVEKGPTKGQTCKVIFHLAGDTLHYCGTYDATHPAEFKAVGNWVYIAWTRARPGAAAPPVALVPPPPLGADAREVDLVSEVFSTDLPLAESKEAIHRVSLTCQLKDGGMGTLYLDPNAPRFDEFGQAVAEGKRLPVVKLDCTLKLSNQDAGVQRYEIRGAKIASRLGLTTGVGLPYRFLVHGKSGEVRYLIQLREMLRFPPCHPGCFPAGTKVRIPDGTKVIERIREGDLVTTVDADGKPFAARVTGIFVTRNRVLEVRTEDGGKLVTTETQPIARVAGGFRPAGELKKGERIWRWTADKRQAVAVVEVSAARQETKVFNVVLGESQIFIAGDFLVRSKPPALEPRPAIGAVRVVAPPSQRPER